jgi:signal transduction histidine kinase
MLATLLARPRRGTGACISLWRQLVDLLAQGRFTADPELGAAALDCIEELRGRVPADIKAQTAGTFAGAPVSAAVVALFAEEPAHVVAPIITSARLSAEEWLDLLPRLTPTARALMRHRRDLPKDVVRALDSFGASDFVIASDVSGVEEDYEAIAPLPVIEEAVIEYAEVEDVVVEDAVVEERAPEETLAEEPMIELPPIPNSPRADSAPPPPVDGGAQIRELMARIEAYRAQDFIRPAAPSAEGEQDEADRVDEHGFRFETGADGAICWISGVPRGPLIGETIAIAGSGSDHGVDGHAAGAFRQRAPFRDARLTIGGDSVVAGEWRISAVPVFGQIDGRFSGYRGTARRPRFDEVAVPASEAGVFGDPATADSLRQLVHELRTPLNAIIGFSEMIEGQHLGPASAGYRAKASDIGSQGRRLLDAIEDLDFSAHLQTGRRDEGSVDPAELLERLHGEYQSIADARGFKLKFKIRTGIGEVAANPVAVERMFSRLIAATLAIAQPGETIRVELAADRHMPNRMVLSVARPGMLIGRDEQTLLDPGYHPDGDSTDAPVLGLGFALRLVRNIAKSSGGKLDIDADKLLLKLPMRKQVARRGKG